MKAEAVVKLGKKHDGAIDDIEVLDCHKLKWLMNQKDGFNCGIFVTEYFKHYFLSELPRSTHEDLSIHFGRHNAEIGDPDQIRADMRTFFNK